MRLVCEATRDRDLRERFIREQHQPFRMFDTSASYVTTYRHPERNLEGLGEVVVAQANLAGAVSQPEFLMQGAVNERLNRSGLPGREAAATIERRTCQWCFITPIAGVVAQHCCCGFDPGLCPKPIDVPSSESGIKYAGYYR